MKHLNVTVVGDKTKPNGTRRKLLVIVSLARKNGWKHKINFEKGLSIVINDFLKHQINVKK